MRRREGRNGFGDDTFDEFGRRRRIVQQVSGLADDDGGTLDVA